MKRPMMVYLVSTGEYSDYRVHAAFSDESVADRVAGRMGGVVEARTLYAADPPRRTVHVIEWDARGHGGREPHVWEHSYTQEDWDSPSYGGHEVRGVGMGHYGPDFYRYWGEDKERVTKAFHDYHARMRAEKAGIG